MRKLIATLIALTMLLSLSVNAFAAENSSITSGGEGNNSATTEVKGTYQAGKNDDVYSVTIEWGIFSYTYVGEGKSWNTDNLTSSTIAAHWEENNNATIKVTNASSVNIKATFSFTKANTLGETEVGMTFEGKEEGVTVTQNAITVSNTSGSNSATVLAKPTGSLPSNWTSTAKIGDITVTIAKVVDGE